MRFYADLHIHSKYSRATSRDLDLEHLTEWAYRKGITVLATGDFTHPVWLAELKSKLIPAEPGLFRLRPEIEAAVQQTVPGACQAAENRHVRFMLSVEISTIYKKGDRTRKIHHLLYAPDFDSADRIVARLARIGNIASDGRPILGLDSRNLLEIVLESHPASYLVPAHIWTPWFAVLGSKSGFDSITECYGDLSEHIFAVETGLSSDPPMNWRLSMLDKYRLTSNSDAHSPGKLGREATMFDTDVDYFAIRRALETGAGYVGTTEFFPEEGKYHADGHRKCQVRFSPQETLEHAERCPVCGQPLTVGVLHRIEALADRSETNLIPPPTAGEISNLVPLPEILSEIVGTGPSSKAVVTRYDRLVATLGPELEILRTIPTEDIVRAESSLLGEAITRLRSGQVIRDAGYDGEYGVIRLFQDDELRQHSSGSLLFDLPISKKSGKSTRRKTDQPPSETAKSHTSDTRAFEISDADAVTIASSILRQLDPDQRAAASVVHGPLMILAGPGSGKTRTLTHRVAHLLADHHVSPASCLAITFTRRAAKEMRERLEALVPEHAAELPIHTFHSFGLSILKEHPNDAGLQRGFRIADDAECLGILMGDGHRSERKAQSLLRAISLAKRTGNIARGGDEDKKEIAEAMAQYQAALDANNWIDCDDLIRLPVQLLETHPDLVAHYRDRYRWISVDEFQDVDDQQYRLLTLLAPPDANVCVIGDPNQAIYGFRGANAACFERFAADYPKATVVRLSRNYRSSGTIVTASSQVIKRGVSNTTDDQASTHVREMLDRITLHAAPSEAAEAEFVVHSIERMIGGHSFYSIDTGRSTGNAGTAYSFSDFAILYRTDAQAEALTTALARSGIPFAQHNHEPLKKQYAELYAKLYGEDHVQTAEHLAFATDADVWDARAKRVSLLTLHASKGLEFPVVFIVGLEDGILPLRWGSAPLDPEAHAEERRLFYVGITRAKDRLVLSRAAQRRWRGKACTLEASPFLDDIERALVEQERAAARRAKDDRSQLTLL